MAGMSSKNKRKRRKENWSSRSRKSFLLVARSWNFRWSNGSLWTDLREGTSSTVQFAGILWTRDGKSGRRGES